MFSALRPLLFRLDPERAHRLTIAALRAGLGPRGAVDPPGLAVTLAGLALPNPIGLAAGFDKNAEVPDAMLRLGFGFVETGTVTPRAQPGNPRPRLFRLVEDDAVINRLGFNNAGVAVHAARLERRLRHPGVVGVNVGANKDSDDRIGDYVTAVRAAGRFASYVTANISSPNTPGLRGLQSAASLRALIARLGETGIVRPLFVKVAPDLAADEIAAIANIAETGGVAGLIVANTTLARPALRSAAAGEAGGLSGRPLAAPALGVLRAFAGATGGRLPLIAVGGIASGADVYARLRAGATAVQLYTGLVYHGPALVARIKGELAALLAADGYATVAAAIGVDAGQ